MKILITGANGFIGSALARSLADSGHEVLGLVRSAPPDDAALPYTPVIGDVTKSQSLTGKLAGVDVVVHSAGRAHLMNDTAADPLLEFRTVNTAGTQALAKEAARAGVKRLVFLSSIKVNGEETAPGQIISVASPVNPVDPYAVSKLEAEQFLIPFGRDTGLEICVIRPPLVYGQGVKGNVARLSKALARGIPLPFGALTGNRRSMVHIDNLTSLITTCMTHPAAAGQVFLASDNRSLSTSAFLTALAEMTGHSARQINVPTWVLTLLGRLTGKSDEVKRLTGDFQLNIDHTMTTLDWQPPVRFGPDPSKP